MLTIDRLSRCRGGDDVLTLFAELGYPIEPVAIDAAEWARARVAIPWNGNVDFRLAARLRRLDLFLVGGIVPPEALQSFLKSYSTYNRITKSAIINITNSCTFSVYDLSAGGRLRRLDVSLSAPSVHAVDRLNLLAASETVPPASFFDAALDRERLGRRFFERFRSATCEVAGALTETFPDEPEDACDSQALLILSRLLFLCFVQEKGWLNAERRFLFDRLAQDRYYSAVLRPLFFGCLNTPAKEREPAARRLGRIPYLNGGLFEPSPFEVRHPDLDLPDALLRLILREVFQRFDFSTDEEDDAGVHVDPEMLGKVFESLMEEDERAATGSFYTPRPVVDVLVSRAIDAWLEGADAVERLRRLETITVLDPACGSGAFLLSALGVIERRIVEASRECGVEPEPELRQSIVERSLFGVDLKPGAVRLCELRLWLAIVSSRNVEIEKIPPLPNLDRNILQGNALLAPTDFLGGARGDVYHQWVHALRAQRDVVERYRCASRADRPAMARLICETDRRLAAELLQKAIEIDDAELQRALLPEADLFGDRRTADLRRCAELRERLNEHRRLLQRVEEGTLDFFSFDIHFAPVMAAGGFDVVVGNPPWVRNSRIDRRTRRLLTDRYALFRSGGDSPAFHQPDLSVAFFERALALCAGSGAVAMLMPSKIANAAYASPLRRALLREDLVSIDDWSGDSRRLFDANTFPMGITVARRKASRFVTVRECAGSFEVAKESLGAGPWSLVPPEVSAILERLRSSHPSLMEATGRRPVMGVKTGDNRACFLGELTVRRGVALTEDGVAVPLSHLARCVRGRDVRRWSSAPSEWIVWPPHGGFRRAPDWLERLAAARDVDPTVFSLAYVRPEHVGIKVAWKDVSRGMSAVVLPDVVHVDDLPIPLVPNQTLYSIDTASLDEAYAICAFLNSTIAGALLVATAERAKDSHFRYFGRTVAAIPFPAVSPCAPEIHAIVRLARRAHRGADVVDAIDSTAARVWGVSDRELGVLQKFVDERLGRQPR